MRAHILPFTPSFFFRFQLFFFRRTIGCIWREHEDAAAGCWDCVRNAVDVQICMYNWLHCRRDFFFVYHSLGTRKGYYMHARMAFEVSYQCDSTAEDECGCLQSDRSIV